MLTNVNPYVEEKVPAVAPLLKMGLGLLAPALLQSALPTYVKVAEGWAVIVTEDVLDTELQLPVGVILFVTVYVPGVLAERLI